MKYFKNILILIFLLSNLCLFSQTIKQVNHFKPFKPTKFAQRILLGDRFTDEGFLYIKAFYVIYKNPVYNQLELFYVSRENYMLAMDRCTQSQAIGFLKRNYFKITK